MKLIFVLGQNYIDLYEGSVHIDNLKYSYNSDTKRLNLTERFQEIWQKNFILIKVSKELELHIKKGASFTDTRIIAMWCRSNSMFNKKATFKTIKDDESSDQISYIQQPKITIKK
jgi:hypothetical protein